MRAILVFCYACDIILKRMTSDPAASIYPFLQAAIVGFVFMNLYNTLLKESHLMIIASSFGRNFNMHSMEIDFLMSTVQLCKITLSLFQGEGLEKLTSGMSFERLLYSYSIWH